ncbi:MAG TPA: sulfatase [Anaerolineae bacterium]|nr:sulfatase [Anaerolineae bacterium]
MSKSLTRRDLLKLASLAPLLALPARGIIQSTANALQPSNRPNVLMIVFDTLSAKHMSLYGYPRQTTPNLARFAKRATVFHKHYAGGNFTSAGTSSLLTGSYTWTQRGFNFLGTVSQEYEHKTLFRMFRDAGYYTVAYTHNWLVSRLLDEFQDDISYWKPTRELCLIDTEIAENFFPNDHGIAFEIERETFMHSTYGTGSLFLSMLEQMGVENARRAMEEKYKDLYPRGLPTNNETTFFLMEDAVDWIQNQFQQVPRPFFGYVHLLPPHEPYRPRKEFIGRYNGDKVVEVEKPPHPLGATIDEPAERVARRNYDEFLTYADAEFGRLYDALVKNGMLDNTVLVFTSDHGQMLERGVKGHITPLLYETITRIPLIISVPSQTQRVNVRVPTSCLDLLPTLAQLIGQPIPDWAEGQPLPKIAGKANSGRSVFTIEAKMNAKQAPLTKATIAMVIDDYKFIHYLGYEEGYDNFSELYNLEQDPEEMTNLVSTKPETASELKAELLGQLEQANQRYRRL